MSRAFSGTNQYVGRTAATFTAAPFTLAAWFKTPSLPGTGVYKAVFSIASTASSFNLWESEIDGDNSGKLNFYCSDNSVTTTGNAVSANIVTAGVWQHAVGIATSVSSRTSVLNGDWANRGTNVISITPASVNDEYVGILSNTLGLVDDFDGEIAEFAGWNVALTQQEVEALAKGAHPFTIRPANLVAYRPLYGNLSPEIDLVGGISWTITGATKGATHAPIWRPSNPAFLNASVVAAGASANYFPSMNALGFGPT